MSFAYRERILNRQVSRWRLAAVFMALFLFGWPAGRALAAPPAGYYLVWSDEFNGTALDTNKWDYWLLDSRRDAVNVTNAVSLNGSNLVITTYTSDGTNFTAMVATDQTFRTKYGYWEASVKWGDTNGMWSAIWMQSPTMGANINDPVTSGSEIDIAEHRYVDVTDTNNISNQFQNNIHWNGYASGIEQSAGSTYTGISSGFHTNGFLWTTSNYSFYIDGNNWRSWSYANNGVPVSASTEWMIFSSEVDDTSTTWAGTISTGGYSSLAASTTKLQVDYARYYAPTTSIFWTGSASAYWTNSANWIAGKTPWASADLTFGQLATNNYATALGANLSVDSLTVLETDSAISINDPNTLTLGAGGIDMIFASADPLINCPLNLSAAQTWNIGGMIHLNVNSNLSGTVALTKTGTGTVFLKSSNSFSSTLYLDTGLTSTNNDGEIRVFTSDALANVPSPLQLRNAGEGSSTFQMDGSAGTVVVNQDFSISGRTADNTVPCIENVTGSNVLAGSLNFYTGGQCFNLTCDAGTLALAGTNRYLGNVYSSRIITYGGAGNTWISGRILESSTPAPTTIVKSVAGTLTLAATNTFAGGTLLSQGIIQANANAAFGTGTVTNDPGANTARILLANSVNIANGLVANSVNSSSGNYGMIMVNDNTSATWSGPISFFANAASGGHFCGPLTTGVLNLTGPVTTGATNFLVIRAGNVRFSGGGNYPELQPRSQTTSLGANNGIATNAVIDLAGNGSTTTPTALDLNGFDQTLAGLKNLVNNANAAWVTNSAATTNTLTLNLGPTNFSFGGSIVGRVAVVLNSGTQAFAKTGTSALNGLYTYSGNTTVNGGTLALGSGQTLPNTPVIAVGSGATLDVSASGLTLGAAQTLKGNGTVLGNLTVNGTLAPGGSIGVLTCSNNVTLQTGSTNYFELNKAAGTNDQLRVGGSLNYTGTLFVTNLAGALVGGDSFKFFSATSAVGNFFTLAGSPGAGLAWKFNPTNGVLTVYSTVPPSLSVLVTNHTLQLAWPADRLGWTLQVQTNNLNYGLGTNWISLANSSTNTQFSALLNPMNPSVFYRLIYQ